MTALISVPLPRSPGFSFPGINPYTLTNQHSTSSFNESVVGCIEENSRGRGIHGVVVIKG
jgi:hypothetical protein